MIFGYTLFDPLVVFWGTSLAIWYLNRNPVRLVGFMPTALSLWFFIPLVTNLTLWQTVPLLLAGRVLLKGSLRMPRFAHPVLIVVTLSFALSAGYALLAGADQTRALIRTMYYLGLFATLAFAYEMGRKSEAYEILLKGLVVMGSVYAAYGAYQVLAFYMGLPVRGIVYSANGASIMAFEGGLLRINSFANEPKRLGYVLFLAAMACIFLASIRAERRAQQLRWFATGIFGVSLLTFSGSYFVAIALFGLVSLLLYPSQSTIYTFGILAISFAISFAIPDLGILDALQHGYERRMAEIDIGLNGTVVYRQEFFAWDYLANNPFSYLTGVGLGQYYSELSQAYGIGAGYNERGGLMPLNSNFLELVFDLGGVSAAVVYGGLAFPIVSLRRIGETFLCLSLLFLALQSLSILNLLYISLFAGVAMGRLVLHQNGTVQSNGLTSTYLSNGLTLK